MKIGKTYLPLLAAGASLLLSGQAMASGRLVSPNGTTQIGINDDGSLNAYTDVGTVGIGYNFTGQGGREGFQDALTPGCLCESWGVSANGVGGQVGQANGNQGITIGESTNVGGTFTSNTSLAGLPGLTISQAFSLSSENASGALFINTVTIHNGTGGDLTDLRYARALDWDVPPTEFSEFVTIKGVATTASLLHSTDDGFANANPLNAIYNTGIIGPNDSDGITGPSDHGSLFVFGFGDLAENADYTFNIYFGAAGNKAGALDLLGAVSPELYNLGQSTVVDPETGTYAAGDDLPTFIFAFNGVGGSVVVPPPAVPEPATWAMMIGGFGLVGGAMRRQRTTPRLA